LMGVHTEGFDCIRTEGVDMVGFPVYCYEIASYRRCPLSRSNSFASSIDVVFVRTETEKGVVVQYLRNFRALIPEATCEISVSVVVQYLRNFWCLDFRVLAKFPCLDFRVLSTLFSFASTCENSVPDVVKYLRNFCNYFLEFLLYLLFAFELKKVS